ncbi:hypothetical protein ALC56_07792, partial [Trachymyrmex septentrionalis]
PVAEMTYFDSGTIEHVREREVIRYQAAVMASLQSQSNFESGYPRAGVHSGKPRVHNRFPLYTFHLASSKTSENLSTRPLLPFIVGVYNTPCWIQLVEPVVVYERESGYIEKDGRSKKERKPSETFGPATSVNSWNALPLTPILLPRLSFHRSSLTNSPLSSREFSSEFLMLVDTLKLMTRVSNASDLKSIRCRD